MEIERLEECPVKNPNLLVKVTEMGNVIEVQYITRRNNKATIQMLPGGKQYVNLSTGEVNDCEMHDSRADQKKSLYRTFKTARGLINANVTDVSKVRWITLTYSENMTDTAQLYKDFEKFNKRFQDYCRKKDYGKPEYIVMMEPQGRGAWHAHLLYIWDTKAPYISNNDELERIWGHGWTKIKKLDNVDNVGAYLTAYLGDMEIEDCLSRNMDISGMQGKKCEVQEDDGSKNTKYYIKGARLCYYPANFNMVRCSRGVKRPTEEMISQFEAEKKVLGSTKTYEKTVKLVDSENDFESIINTVQYNKIRKNSQ